MKKYLLILFLLPNAALFAQNHYPDSIEYCWWRQIYYFKLLNHQYFFGSSFQEDRFLATFQEWNIVESDSLIFESTRYFQNFTRKTDYIDSVRFAIVSRTLKKYGEKILYNKGKPFIRFEWLKYTDPVLLTIFPDHDSAVIIYKEGNGCYDIHGYVTKKIQKKVSAEVFKNSMNYFTKADFFNLKHAIGHCHEDSLLNDPPDFFVEVYDGKNYNIVVLPECNMDYKNYKECKRAFNYLFRKVR